MYLAAARSAALPMERQRVAESVEGELDQGIPEAVIPPEVVQVEGPEPAVAVDAAEGDEPSHPTTILLVRLTEHFSQTGFLAPDPIDHVEIVHYAEGQQERHVSQEHQASPHDEESRKIH